MSRIPSYLSDVCPPETGPLCRPVGAAFADDQHAAELMENAPVGTLVRALTLLHVPSAAQLSCHITDGDDAGTGSGRGVGERRAPSLLPSFATVLVDFVEFCVVKI